jgi:hypothetical protein
MKTREKEAFKCREKNYIPLSLDIFPVAEFSAVDETIVSKFDAGALSSIISSVITVFSILSSLISIDDGVMTLDALSTSEVCNKKNILLSLHFFLPLFKQIKNIFV